MAASLGAPASVCPGLASADIAQDPADRALRTSAIRLVDNDRPLRYSYTLTGDAVSPRRGGLVCFDMPVDLAEC